MYKIVIWCRRLNKIRWVEYNRINTERSTLIIKKERKKGLNHLNGGPKYSKLVEKKWHGLLLGTKWTLSNISSDSVELMLPVILKNVQGRVFPNSSPSYGGLNISKNAAGPSIQDIWWTFFSRGDKTHASSVSLTNIPGCFIAV